VTDEMRANRDLMTDLAGIFSIKVDEKVKNIKENVTKYVCNQITQDEDWKIEVSGEPSAFNCYKVPKPSIQFKDSTYDLDDSFSWNREIRTRKFVDMKPLIQWAIVYTSSSRDEYYRIEKCSLEFLREGGTTTYIVNGRSKYLLKVIGSAFRIQQDSLHPL